LRQLLNGINLGDIILGDRYYCSYFLLAELILRGADAVFQIHASRHSDFRRGDRICKGDHIVEWKKPARPEWMSEEKYNSIPNTLRVREIKQKHRIIVTTILDAKKYSKQNIALLYGLRWNVELDLRSIKDIMRMDVLRCKTPAMVRKELWAHLLGYNIIRYMMAQAGKNNKTNPRNLSFKKALQSFNSFCRNASIKICVLFDVMLREIARCKLVIRPGRKEPRVVKRRPKNRNYMTKPRNKYERKLAHDCLS